MIALLQRVRSASVTVAGQCIGEIAHGMLIFLAVQQDDDKRRAQRMVEKIAGYRMFSDDLGKMNRNVQQSGGSLLVVSQFTLAADTGKGLRPSFSHAAEPEQGRQLYQYVVDGLRHYTSVATGQFGADMQVALVNDGPVTFSLQT